MNLDDNTVKIILAVIALIAGGSFIAYKVSKKHSDNKTINQNDNKVDNGDIVGGDKITGK
jgi:uncharacterized protein YneF (UPF0154 family)